MSRFGFFGTAAHGSLRLLLRVAGAAVAAAAALLVGVAVWLAQGPVSVGFLTPYLQDALQDTGLEVEIADTVIDWRGFDEGLDVRLTGARVRGRGADAAQIVLPAVHLRLSGRALLRGDLRPAALEVDGAKLRVVREADGRFELGLGGPGTDGAADAGFGDWLKANFAGEGGSAIEELRRVVLRGAELEIEDRALGRTFRAPRTDLAVWRDGGLIGATLTGAIEFGAKPVNIALDARWRGGTAPVEAALRFDGLEPAALAGLDPALQQLAALRMLLSGRLQGSFTQDGPTTPVAFSLAGTDGVLELLERFPKPVSLRKVELRGDLTARLQAGVPQLERLRVEQLELQTAGPRIVGNATVTLAAAGPGIEAQAAVTGLALKELELYWPIGMAANARSWVTANIQDGTVPEAKLTVNLAPGAMANPPREAVLFQFAFEGVTAEYIKRMPKITHGKGQARIDGREFQLDLASGRAGKLNVSEGKLVIDGLHVKDQTADIQLLVTGPVPTGLELLDSPPLGLASRFGFSPSSASGNTAVRLRFGFPVENSLTMEQVRFTVAANITELTLKGLFDKYELAGGTVAISCNPKGLAAEGQGALAGIPLSFKWREEFGVAGAPSRYEASATLDDAARARLGLAADAYLSGPVPITVAAAVRRGGAVEAKVEASLDRASLKLDEIEWRKPIGVPGRASAILRAAGGGAPLRIDELAIDAAELTVRGRLELDKDTLRLAELTRVKWPEADIALKLERDARGNANVALSGARVDLRRYNPPPAAKPPPPSPRPIPGAVDTTKPRISVKIGRLDRVQLSDTMNFAAVAGELEIYGGRLGSMRARATLEDGPPLNVEIAPAGKRRSLQVTTDDAAKLARALDLVQGAEGGRLSVRGELRDDEPGGPLVGRVQIDEFRLVRAPVLARILSLGSLTGISDLLTGSGIAFTRLEIPFTQLDDVITIADARAVGPALGLTAEGIVDRAKDRLDLRGTVVPAYTINSVLGNIPLLGTLLVGRKGEGVFAINFRVTGHPDDPSVSVNPLTALAPGYLRTIIGVLERGIENSLPSGPAPSDSPGAERR